MWIKFIFVIEQPTKALAYNAEYFYFCKVGVSNHSSRHSRTRGISLSFIWRSGKFLNWYKDKSKCLSSHVYYYQDNIWVRHGLFLFISRLLPEPPNEINYSFHAFFCIITFWKLRVCYIIMTDLINQLNLKMNQNTLIFLISMFAIGVGEYFHLPALYYCSLVVGIISIISLGFCLYAYTKNYMKNKNRSNKN